MAFRLPVMLTLTGADDDFALPPGLFGPEVRGEILHDAMNSSVGSWAPFETMSSTMPAPAVLPSCGAGGDRDGVHWEQNPAKIPPCPCFWQILRVLRECAPSGKMRARQRVGRTSRGLCGLSEHARYNNTK